MLDAPPPPGSVSPSRGRRLVTRIRTSQGVRAGAMVAVATVVMNFSSYLFNVACIRYLGSRVYGDVATILALSAIIALPLGSLQVLLAREVAHAPSTSEAGAMLRRWIVRAAAGAAVLLAVGLALLAPIQDALSIDSRKALAIGLSAIVAAVLASVMYGVLQGVQRFRALSVAYAAGGIARPILVVPALLLGFAAVGAIAVSAFAGLIALAIVAWALRDVWRTGRHVTAPAHEIPQVTVMLVGTLAFASLTNTDILMASYYLDDADAGVYAAAALLGKMVLFLPAAVVTVLLPKAASRWAAGVASQGILFASLAVTLLVTLGAAVVLALVPEEALVRAFGGDFRESTGLLGWFGLAMSAAALVNVYLSVYLAERDLRFPLLVAGAAVSQIVAVTLFHAEALSIVLVTLTCATSVLVIHELFFPYAVVRVLRARRDGTAEARPDPEPLFPS